MNKPFECITSFQNGIEVGERKELVRCKDCKHGELGACGDGVDCDGVWHGDDWFCADGERRTDKCLTEQM